MRDVRELGQVLCDLREAAGLKLCELSKLCGVNVSQLSDYEYSTNIPRLPTLKRIATVLPIQVEEWEEPIRAYLSTRYHGEGTEGNRYQAAKPSYTGPSLDAVRRAADAAKMTYGEFVARFSPAEIAQICSMTGGG